MQHLVGVVISSTTHLTVSAAHHCSKQALHVIEASVSRSCPATHLKSQQRSCRQAQGGSPSGNILSRPGCNSRWRGRSCQLLMLWLSNARWGPCHVSTLSVKRQSEQGEGIATCEPTWLLTIWLFHFLRRTLFDSHRPLLWL
jgi:hypothetical protein